MLKGRLGFLISLFFAHIVYAFLRITKISAGTSIIGVLVLRLCPDFLKYANKCILNKKICITGTNGKTTTSGLITHIIKNSGSRVINNSLGANMRSGIVNALSLQINPLKKTDYSVLETDEANVELVCRDYKFDCILVTNLFRDQLDRYGELETTKHYIQKGIDLNTDIKILLNADDPLVSTIESDNKIYYGVENITFSEEYLNQENSLQEAFTCKCGQPLIYDKRFYAQQGHYKCSCGFKRPEPKYNAEITLLKDSSVIKINETEYKVPLVGLFNAYNALGAISIALELGIEDIQTSLETFKTIFGRSEIKYLNNHKALIQLIKNPIGANEVLKTIDLNSNLLIIINDNYADGRDVSWLWDANFEYLNACKKQITVSGTRANDMALRLKYAGIDTDQIKIISDIKKAVDFTGKNADNNITILPTYTALLKLNKIKSLKMGKGK